MSVARWISREIRARSWEKIFSLIIFLFLVTLMLNKDLSNINRISSNNKHEDSAEPLNCGYQNCPKAEKDLINIHLVPHSHDDPGYKKTIEEYFYGLRNDIQNVSVSKILTNVIHQLTLNKDRRFVYVEVIYFWKWWEIQTESTRETVRNLVRNGRLEFLNGGWCVNDEATPNYADIIDQMSLGLNVLSETFGECGRPKVAIQADTFGHSREQALLNSLMGFDALFVGRVDREDKKRRIEAKEMEMIWSGSDLPGKHPSIFTGITYNIFDPPPGFCFDNMCGAKKISEPLNDDVDSKGYNIDKRVDEFIAYCMKQADAYKTNNIVVYMGSDYTYGNAEVWFSNMDKLIKHVNNRQKDGSPYNLFYSTPACYVKAVNEAEVTWPTKKDDFFPYHWENFAYWTGYFSSRPALKYMIRQGSSLLQACKQMASILQLTGAEDEGDLSVMKDAMAVMQHHDGISGTHSQRVSDDYVRVLNNGFEECRKTVNSYYQEKLPVDENIKESKIPVSYCQLNISQCEVTDKKGSRFVVNIYNPLGQYLNKYIRVPVSRDQDEMLYNIRVLDSNGKILPSQLMPIPSFVTTLPGRNSSANHELIFLATKVPPLGSKSYYVEASVSRGSNKDLSIPVPLWDSSLPTDQIKDLTISNEKLSVVVSKDTGLITSVTLLGKQMALEQQFFWYNGNGGNCSFDTKTASGAYVFNPLNNTAVPIKIETKNVTVYRGNLVEEIHQTFNHQTGQIIRLYKGKDYIEFDWVIGPVPIKDGIGKEIITRYSTNFKNNGQFYTDANGRQNVLRTRDKRQKYKLSGNDPIASNYYPITSHAFLSDSKTGYRMNVLTDRAQGGGSIEDGQLELLIHRRHVQEDLCLFKEPLDETPYGKGLVVRGTHTLFFQDTKSEDSNKLGSSTLRSLVLERSREPIISFISTKYTTDQWLRFFNSKIQLLSRPLPENVKLLTFEPRIGYEGEFLLRLEHIYDAEEHPVLSSPTEVSLKGLFKGFSIAEIEETTLDGNLFKSDLVKLSWKSTDKDVDANFDYHTSPSTSLERIKLMPMEIRTFIIKLFAN